MYIYIKRKEEWRAADKCLRFADNPLPSFTRALSQFLPHRPYLRHLRRRASTRAPHFGTAASALKDLKLFIYVT